MVFGLDSLAASRASLTRPNLGRPDWIRTNAVGRPIWSFQLPIGLLTTQMIEGTWWTTLRASAPKTIHGNNWHPLGLDDVEDLCLEVDGCLRERFPDWQAASFAEWGVTSLDLALDVRLENPQVFIESLEKAVWAGPYRVRHCSTYGPRTLYVIGRSVLFRTYSKQEEVAMRSGAMLEELLGIVRLELRLRRSCMVRAGVDVVGAIDHEVARNVYMRRITRLFQFHSPTSVLRAEKALRSCFRSDKAARLIATFREHMESTRHFKGDKRRRDLVQMAAVGVGLGLVKGRPLQPPLLSLISQTFPSTYEPDLDDVQTLCV